MGIFRSVSTDLHPASRGAGSRRRRPAAASWAFSAWLVLVALGSGLGLGGAAGCSRNPNNPFFDEPDSGESSGANAGLDGGDTFADGGGQTFSQNDAGAQGALAVTPPNPVLSVTVPGPAGKQSFMAMSGSGTVSAKWSVDDATLGSIDGNGVFTASGKAGGVATVTATAGGATASTTVTVHLAVTDNAGNVSTAVQGQLTAGGSADSAFRWLYPYDKTVFPRGLTAPVLQFDGTSPTGVLVHVSSKNLDYKGFFGASSPPGQVTLGAAAWTLVTASAGASDPVQIDVTKIAGTSVSGPIRESWTIAQGTLKGTVYYDTYDSTVAMGGGAVMRIKPGTPAQVLLENCTTCHAVSADGSTLVASANHGNDESFDLRQDAGVKATVPDTTWSFGAVYPDGSLVLQSGGGNIPGMDGLTPSKLWDTKTGLAVAAPGFDGVVVNAVMPTFSPDGKKVAFNDETVGSGHTLSVMGFDVATKTFSGLTQVVSTTTDNYLGWPAFLPSSTAFLFGNVDAADFATWEMHHGDLSVVDVGEQGGRPLDALNGVAGERSTCPTATPRRTSTTSRRCCRSPSAATTGRSSRAGASTATRSPTPIRGSPARRGERSSGSRRSIRPSPPARIRATRPST